MGDPVGHGPPDAPPPTSPVSSSEEQRLLRRARRGDDGAFAAIVERCDEQIRSLVAGLVGAGPMDELVLATYVKAYRALPRTGDSTAVHSWLHRIAYTSCLDRLRRESRRAGRARSTARTGPEDRRRGPADARATAARPDTPPAAGNAARPGRPRVEEPDPAGPRHWAPTDPMESTALQAMAALPVDVRAVLLLIDRHGLLVADVARTLGIGTSAVRTLLDQARSGYAAAVPDGFRARSSDRDAGYDDWVDAIPVPPHGPAFWNDLGRQLLVERSSPALPTPEAMAVAARAPDARPRAAETGGAPPVPWLDVKPRVASARPSFPFGTALMVVVGCLAIAGLAALALRIGADAEPPLERQGTVAQEVGERVVVRLAGLLTFSSTVERTEVVDGQEAVSRYDLLRTLDGSYRLTGEDPDLTVTYDAPSDTRRERTVRERPDGLMVTAREETGFASGPPDPSPGYVDLPDADVGLALRSLRSSDRRLAREGQVGGRAVWLLEAGLEDGAPVAADAIVLTVDQASLLPVSVRISLDGQPVRITTFRDVIPNGPAPPGSFTFEFAPGDDVVRTDHGFAPIALRDVPNRLGFEALRPTFLPEGFTLDATQARAEGAVVSLRYRRGFERVVVSTRLSPVPAGERWADPFGFQTGRPSSSVTLRAGVFARQEMALATGPAGTLELWGSDGAFAITVSGDLTRREIQQVAESLR